MDFEKLYGKVREEEENMSCLTVSSFRSCLNWDEIFFICLISVYIILFWIKKSVKIDNKQNWV